MNLMFGVQDLSKDLEEVLFSRRDIRVFMYVSLQGIVALVDCFRHVGSWVRRPRSMMVGRPRTGNEVDDRKVPSGRSP